MGRFVVFPNLERRTAPEGRGLHTWRTDFPDAGIMRQGGAEPGEGCGESASHCCRRVLARAGESQRRHCARGSAYLSGFAVAP
jgi:hypothetical protein